MMTPEEASTITELDLTTATGVWAIGTSSATVYYVDTDNRTVLRARAEGSGIGAGDNRWCPLVSVTRFADDAPDVITVGRRHRYVLDPDPVGGHHQWWVQRVVSSIAPVPADAVPGRGPEPASTSEAPAVAPVLVASLSDLAEGTWIVRTESAASYVLDLEARICARILGETGEWPDERTSLRRDGEDVRLIGVVRCEVGAPMVLFVQVRPDKLTHRTTTPVISIERA